MAKRDNPVLEIFKGVKIRKWNTVELQLRDYAYKKLLNEVDSSGLSIQKVLAYSGQPCERCKGVDVQFLDKDGNLKKIKKGILQVPESNGVSILDKARKRNNTNE